MRAISIIDRPSTHLLNADEAAGLRSRFADWADLTQNVTGLRVQDAQADRALRSQVVAEGFR